MSRRGYSPPLSGFRLPGCSVEGCTESVGGGWPLGGRCAFHDLIANARDLSPEAYDRLRDALASTPPRTAEEKRVRQVRATLARVEWTARDAKRAKRSARDAGATHGQVADAARRGKAQQ